VALGGCAWAFSGISEPGAVALGSAMPEHNQAIISFPDRLSQIYSSSEIVAVLMSEGSETGKEGWHELHTGF
jgi:hypothetical protein